MQQRTASCVCALVCGCEQAARFGFTGPLCFTFPFTFVLFFPCPTFFSMLIIVLSFYPPFSPAHTFSQRRGKCSRWEARAGRTKKLKKKKKVDSPPVRDPPSLPPCPCVAHPPRSPLSLIFFEDENTSSHLYPVPFFFLPNLYGTAGGAAAAQRAGRQLGTGGHASCRTSCRGGACAPGIGAWTGGNQSKVAASVFCTATLSRPHQRLYQPWVAAPRSGAGARMARERTSCATRRSDSSLPISHASTHSRCGPRRRSSG